MGKSLYGLVEGYSTSLYDCGNRLKRLFAKSMILIFAGKKILDVGAGSGDFSYFSSKK